MSAFPTKCQFSTYGCACNKPVAWGTDLLWWQVQARAALAQEGK